MDNKLNTMKDRDSVPIALVTGGSRGIGRAIATRLSTDGYAVVVNYIRQQEAAEDTCHEISRSGGEAWAIQADVSNRQEVSSLFQAVAKRHGRLDVLVNNAGVVYVGLVALTPRERLLEVLNTNLIGTFLCCQAALRIMLPKHKGSIINISSSTAVRNPIGLSAYAASKAGVSSLTKTLAKEVAQKGIRVNAIAPSSTDTEMLGMAEQQSVAEMAGRVALGRPASPEEIAAVVSALAREDMTYLIGQVLEVDGGGAKWAV